MQPIKKFQNIQIMTQLKGVIDKFTITREFQSLAIISKKADRKSAMICKT